ncbi:MAG TPA: hypothetical protein VJG67_01325 [Candidatus Paceibacterota bacterium]
MKKQTLKSKKSMKISGIPLAVVSVPDRVYMIERLESKVTSSLQLSSSTDGVIFTGNDKKVLIKNHTGKKENIKNCRNFSISATPTGFVMAYVRAGKKGTDDRVVVAKSSNLREWHIKSEMVTLDSKHATVVYNHPLRSFVMYRDGLFIKSQTAHSLVLWKDKPSLLLTGRYGMFDCDDIEVIGSTETKDGLLVIYNASIKNGARTLLQIGGVLFDAKNPNRFLWRSEVPLWQGVVETKNEKSSVTPVGFVYFKEVFIVYWLVGGKDMIISTFPALFNKSDLYQYEILNRSEKNPILEPRPLEWEVVGTFNPAVFQDKDGLHMFYRALGSDGISRIGYAQSKDGLSFTRRLNYPVFEPTPGLGMPDTGKTKEPVGFNPLYYTSGGGWGGSEDPRVVRIGSRVYMTYVAFEGWNSVRIGLTSINVDDFKKENWKWKKPVLISPVNEVHKNWVLFPEKINGKFAVLHGVSPNILIDYFDSPTDFEKGFCIKSSPPSGGRQDFWDNKMRGAGPPPIKTDLGWLLLYHAHDRKEPHKYKLGAMILDKDNPTKILHRSAHSILSPDMHYENNWKPGIIYASGAVIKGDDLRVYYGGGDKVVCVAETPVKKFLDYLVTEKPDRYELKRVF